MITTEKARDTKPKSMNPRLRQLADETKSGKVKTPKAEKTLKPKKVKTSTNAKATASPNDPPIIKHVRESITVTL
jgi:hypothetical protein